jgi:hypothetical protein
MEPIFITLKALIKFLKQTYSNHPVIFIPHQGNDSLIIVRSDQCMLMYSLLNDAIIASTPSLISKLKTFTEPADFSEEAYAREKNERNIFAT